MQNKTQFINFLILIYVLFIFLLPRASAQNYLIKSLVKPNSIQQIILSSSPTHLTTTNKNRTEVLRYLPQFLFEDQNSSQLYYKEEIVPIANTSLIRGNQFNNPRKTGLRGEVVKIIENGPAKNRINLTIIGDGYTIQERQKFFADVKRIVDGLFQTSTFSSYLSLFNVYAVYLPSAQSGIGDGSPKNTLLGLYRTPKGSRRAIMCDRPSVAREAAELAPGSDYPILLANDEYYGGLGGEFAITTSSLQSSLIVLRHELGHNFGNVGEEYSGGDVYLGANFSENGNLQWKPWLSIGATLNDAKLLAMNYPWKNLKDAPELITINVPAGNYHVIAEISGVGWKLNNEVEVLINEKKFPIEGKFQQDRSFFSLGPLSLPQGTYTIQFKENIKDGDNVLGYYKIYAFPLGYDFTDNKIAGFSVFSRSGNKGYRPTHKSCLMNKMTHDKFCSVDQENMWHQFLKRISLIDEVVADNSMLEVKTLDLKGLGIRWFIVGADGEEKELTQFRNMRKIPLTSFMQMSGKYRVKVNFTTVEVRTYNKHFSDEVDFNI